MYFTRDCVTLCLRTRAEYALDRAGAAGNFLAPLASMSYNAFRTVRRRRVRSCGYGLSAPPPGADAHACGPQVIEIDAIGTFNVSRAVHEAWFGAHGGVIINVSATLYYRGDPLVGHAGAAKAAIGTPCGVALR